MNDETAMLEIQDLLDGVVWSLDTLDAIAKILRDSGYEIHDSK